MSIKQFLCMLCLALNTALSGNAFADECRPQYLGSPSPLPAADAQFLSNAIAQIKNKNRRELLTILDPKLTLVRRYMSGAAGIKGGNLDVHLNPRQISKDMKIHLPPSKVPEFPWDADSDSMIDIPAVTLTDFSAASFNPKTDGTGIMMGRTICDKANSCDVLPFANELEDLLSGLLHCNKNKEAAYVFSDGLLITDMELMPWPIGTALFFSKQQNGYKLAALITFQ